MQALQQQHLQQQQQLQMQHHQQMQAATATRHHESVKRERQWQQQIQQQANGNAQMVDACTACVLCAGHTGWGQLRIATTCVMSSPAARSVTVGSSCHVSHQEQLLPIRETGWKHAWNAPRAQRAHRVHGRLQLLAGWLQPHLTHDRTSGG